MKIAEIRIGKISIPLKKPFKTALRTVHAAEDIVVMIVTDTGVTGYGSAAPTAAITGETQDSIVATITNHIGPKILGRELGGLDELMLIVNSAVTKNTSARAAVDMAIYDAYSKSLGLSFANLLGGSVRPLSTDITISVNAPDEMAADAVLAVKAGFRELKLKVGTDVAIDLQRIQSVRNAVGPDVKIRVDANQGWKPKEAVRIIHQMENKGLDIEFVEQPVAAADIEGLCYVTKHVEIDIVADESVFSAQDAARLLSMGAADIINVKLMKAGGIHQALRIIDVAESFGASCMMSCMLECKIGISAAAILASTRNAIVHVDLDAALLQAADPFVGGVTFHGPAITLPGGPGFGITEVQGWEKIAILTRGN